MHAFAFCDHLSLYQDYLLWGRSCKTHLFTLQEQLIFPVILRQNGVYNPLLGDLRLCVIIKRRISVSDFERLTLPLLGLPISRAWRGHGSAIFFELGRLTHRYKSGRPKADAGMMIEWSWRIEQRSSIQFGSWSTDRKINLGMERLQKRRVEEISLAGRLPEISIRLSGSLWIHSFMTAEGQPDWGIFLPDNSWLTVRRGVVVQERAGMSRSKRVT